VLGRIALLCALVVGGLFYGAAPAYAHAVLLETTPVDGAVVASAPRQATLRFDEAVTLTAQSVQLLDAKGHPVRLGPPMHLAGRATTAAADLPPGLHDGTYIISWRVVSADSHVVSGAFQFSIGAPSPDVAAVNRTASPVPSIVKRVGEVVAYLGFALVAGGAVLLCVVWPSGRPPRRGRYLVWAAFVALFVGTVAALLAQYPYATGGGFSSAFSASALRTTLSTRLGQASLARLGLAIVLAVAVRAGYRAVGAACLLALPLTWTLFDHSHVGVQAWLAVPVGSVHLLAVSLWLGGLITVAACVIGRVPGTAAVLPRFSRFALPCFAVIVLTGLYQTWRQVGTLPALPATEFGRWLLIKLGGVTVIVLLAWYGRHFVQRAQSPESLRYSLAVEGTLGVAVLTVATVMANTAPARTSYAPPVRANIRIAVARVDHVEVRLTPAKQGLNIADIYLVARDGALVPVPGVTAQLAPGRRGSGAQAIRVSAAEPGHYVADTVSIPYAGSWQLQLYVRTSEFDQTPVLVRFRAH